MIIKKRPRTGRGRKRQVATPKHLPAISTAKTVESVRLKSRLVGVIKVLFSKSLITVNKTTKEKKDNNVYKMSLRKMAELYSHMSEYSYTS